MHSQLAIKNIFCFSVKLNIHLNHISSMTALTTILLGGYTCFHFILTLLLHFLPIQEKKMLD